MHTSKTTQLTIKGQTLIFVWIEPGTFMMGSPETEENRYDDEVQHEVTITQGYWMMDTTVTQGLWEAVMGRNPSKFKGKNLPVECVNIPDIKEFTVALNKLMPEEFQVSLPTEEQWEYACRAGTTTPYSFGENITSDQANFSNGHMKGLQQTVAVRSYPPNQWGLYEMHGNVWEWCSPQD